MSEQHENERPQIPQNVLRYIILDKCFHNKEYSLEQLVQKVSDELDDDVSPRTIRTDIKVMRWILEEIKSDVEIKYYRRTDNPPYYQYSKEDFSIFNIPFSTDKRGALIEALRVLQGLKGIPNYEKIYGLILDLEYYCGIENKTYKVVEFEQNDQLKGLEHLPKLIDAALNKKPIHLEYKNFKGKDLNGAFYPYFVKQYNNRWFVFGRRWDSNQFETRALDRIQATMQSNLDNRTDEKDYSHVFDDIIGVSIPDDTVELIEIVLRFTKERFPYVVTKPIHRSQTTLSEEEHTISIKVKPNRELEEKLFSFGPDVEVLSPEWYRKDFAEKIEKTIEQYKKSSAVQN